MTKRMMNSIRKIVTDLERKGIKISVKTVQSNLKSKKLNYNKQAVKNMLETLYKLS